MNKVLAVGLITTILLAPGPSLAQGEERVLACGGVLDGKTLAVAKEDATCEWPFEVDRMEIRCNGWGSNAGDVYFVSEKGTYALNGSAKSNFADPRPIWLDRPEAGTGKIDVGS